MCPTFVGSFNKSLRNLFSIVDIELLTTYSHHIWANYKILTITCQENFTLTLYRWHTLMEQTQLRSCMSNSSRVFSYFEVPNRRADRNKRVGLENSATLLAYLLSELINEQGGLFVYYMKN